MTPTVSSTAEADNSDPRAAGGEALQTPRLPAFLLGIGLGGFFDGIVLHQLLQWHHLLSATDDHPVDTVAGLEANVVADGLFHVAASCVVLVGSVLIVRAWRLGRLAPPWRVHVGLLLCGWGTFNLVEGVVDHHVLRLHHVRDDVADPFWWDLGFLVISAGLVLVGLALAGRVLRPRTNRSP